MEVSDALHDLPIYYESTRPDRGFYKALKCIEEALGIPAPCPECGSINHIMAIEDDDGRAFRVECYNIVYDDECTYCGPFGNSILEAWEKHRDG